MDVTFHARTVKYVRLALIIAVAVFASLAFLLVREYYLLKKEEFHLRHTPLNGSEVSVIRSWMTFDYVNQLFALPPEYLKGALNITDPYYPHMTISEYAEYVHIDANAAVGEIESALASYFTVGEHA